MKKYLKMLPIILYPYLFLIPLIILAVISVDTSTAHDNLILILLCTIPYDLFVIFIAVLNTIFSNHEKYTMLQSARINLLVKLLQIPAYLVIICLTLAYVIMGYWGITFLVYAIIIDLFCIIGTGISSIGLSLLIKKDNTLNKAILILCEIGCFIYFLDIVVGIFYFVVARGKDIVTPDNIDDTLKQNNKISKYPILLVHGMGFRDRKTLNYWGRIPATLEAFGYKVYYGNQDANGSVEDNAKVLKDQILKICKEDHVEKFNVIAHSKGGIDMRYAISSLKIGEKIASLTTINSPHHGSITVDKLLKLPRWFFRLISWFTDVWLKIWGDKNPQTCKILYSLKVEDAKKFNEINKDDPNVYYQSYAFVMRKNTSDIIMWFPHLVVKHIEGENDGLLAPKDVKRGNFRGIYTSSSRRGVSHCDEVDCRRHNFSKKEPRNEYEINDITLFYLNIMKELTDKYGF